MGKILAHLTTHIAMPLSFFYFAIRGRFRGWRDWWCFMGFFWSYFFAIYLVGRWDWLGYPLRYGIQIVAVLSFLFSLWKNMSKGFARSIPERNPLFYAVQIFGMVGFGAVALVAFLGARYPAPAISLDFPLQNGTYFIAQGGSSSLLNDHYLSPSVRYALDITKLDGGGRRAKGLFPKSPTHYFIFGDTVYSPVDGRVVAVQDGIADSPKAVPDTSQVAGNFVAIQKGNIVVFLAHLRQGSIRVLPGDTVRSGQPLAQVGQSGVVDEPMLHIHAEKDGKKEMFSGQGVPLLFSGRFLKRNDLVRVGN